MCYYQGMYNENYKILENKTKEVFALLSPPDARHAEFQKDEPCFFWDGFFINWDELVAEHSMLLDFRIPVADKIKIYDKIVKMFKI